MIDVFASQRQYLDHLSSVVRMLDQEARLLVTSEELLAYARDLGCPNIAIGVPRHAGPPTLVAGYRDADWTFSGRRLALLEHGVGQTYCLAPETRILTDDLKWVAIADLPVGQEILAFEEEAEVAGGRQWRRAEVLETRTLRLPCYRLLLSDGTKLIASADHRWLRRERQMYGWLTTAELQDARRFPKHSSKLMKVMDTWEEDRSWGGGYLAAAFDGEGCLTQTSRPLRQNRLMLAFSQRPNVMLALVEGELRSRGFDFKVQENRTSSAVHLCVRGGTREILRFLGSIRPRRLLGNYQPIDNGQMRGRPVEVLESEYVGEQPVTAMRTSTGTLIAEGFASHNSDVRHKAYAGGPDWERLSLVLSPGPHAAKHWRHFYPGLKVVEVGVPKLDRWCYVRDRPQHDPQVVAFAFHWPCKQTAETWPAFDDWADRIAALPRDRWTLLGHWHPRWGDTLRRWYFRHDIEPVERFDVVLDRADLLVADNTSVMFEWAAVGRPVLCIEESRWRHDVEHGLRFWSHPPGVTAGDALPLEDYIEAALADDPHARELRSAAVAAAYGTLADGQATARAVEALSSWM